MQAELFRSQEEKKFILIRETARHRPSNVRESHASGSRGGGDKKKKGNRSLAQSPFFLQNSLSLKREVRYVREHSKFPFKALK